MPTAHKKNIHYFFEDISFTFKARNLHAAWLNQVAQKEKKNIDCINYIFCSDEYLLSLNEQHLNHHTLTDIITFEYNEPNSKNVSSDIYISIDRVKENALQFNATFTEELRRVMAHGLLHLCGYKDKKEADKANMRKKEDLALALYHKLTA
jgi:probable rRNA maturation factor